MVEAVSSQWTGRSPSLISWLQGHQQLNQLTPPLQQQYQQQYWPRPLGNQYYYPDGKYTGNTNSNYDYFNNNNRLTAAAAEANDNNDDEYLNNILQLQNELNKSTMHAYDWIWNLLLHAIPWRNKPPTYPTRSRCCLNNCRTAMWVIVAHERNLELEGNCTVDKWGMMAIGDNARLRELNNETRACDSGGLAC